MSKNTATASGKNAASPQKTLSRQGYSSSINPKNQNLLTIFIIQNRYTNSQSDQFSQQAKRK